MADDDMRVPIRKRPPQYIAPEEYNAGYRAGLAAALKALEEWRDDAPLTEPCIAVAHYAVEKVRALLEEKP